MAMNEILCAPLPASVIGSGGVTAAPNVFNDRLGRAAIVTAVGGWIAVDVGAGTEIDLAAVLATTAPVGAKWSLTAYATAQNAINRTSVLFNSGELNCLASPEAAKRLHRSSYFKFPAVGFRYYRFEFSTPMAVGRIMVGRSFVALDTMDIGYSFKVVDLGEKRRSENSLVNNTLRGKVLEFSWVWSWMSEQEARGALLDLLAYAGTTRDVLCVLNPDAADLHNVIGYGSLIEEVEGVNVAGGNVDSAYEAKFRLQSRLLLNL